MISYKVVCIELSQDQSFCIEQFATKEEAELLAKELQSRSYRGEKWEVKPIYDN